jgi:hypothetical protein
VQIEVAPETKEMSHIRTGGELCRYALYLGGTSGKTMSDLQRTRHACNPGHYPMHGPSCRQEDVKKMPALCQEKTVTVSQGIMSQIFGDCYVLAAHESTQVCQPVHITAPGMEKGIKSS